MFDELIGQMETVSIEESELGQVFSVDSEGHLATLGDFLAQNAPPAVRASFGLTTAQRHDTVRPVRTLDNEEIKPIVEAYLDSIPQDETLAIVGQGSFNADELRREVESRTALGERITGIVRQHNVFIEEAIKQGKIRKRTEEDVVIPDFDF